MPTLTPQQAKLELKAVCRRIIAKATNGAWEQVNGWIIHQRLYSHKFGTSRFWVLASRTGGTIVEVQGMDTFASQASRYARFDAPASDVGVVDIMHQIAEAEKVNA